MTHDSTWDPTTVQISSVTPSHHLHTNATLKSNQESPKQTQVDHELISMSEAYDKYTFLSQMVKAVRVYDSQTSTVSYVGARSRHSHVSVEEVAKKFKCGIEIAQQTLKTTIWRSTCDSPSFKVQ
jgi:hypothetical protein